MATAARVTREGDPGRYDRLWRAARYAVWLSTREPGVAWPDSALLFTNTAVAADSTRVEGFYYRAIAAGRFAENHTLRGRAAMFRIRDDARRAIAIAPSFEGGGPHRVLGALYLRAPGPPAGVGSDRAAVRELDAALTFAPDHPDNLLYRAEAWLEMDDSKSAFELLDRVDELLERGGVPEDDRARIRGRLEALRSRGGPQPVSASSSRTRSE